MSKIQWQQKVTEKESQKKISEIEGKHEMKCLILIIIVATQQYKISRKLGKCIKSWLKLYNILYVIDKVEANTRPCGCKISEINQLKYSI